MTRAQVSSQSFSRKLAFGDYERLKGNVAEFYEDYGISTTPVDVFSLGQKLGVEIVEMCEASSRIATELSCETDDGFTMHRKNEFKIFLNSDIRNLARRRFTIAHELGHIWLGHFEQDEPLDYQVLEAEANFFAAYLLAPAPLVLTKAPAGDVPLVAKQFGLSQEAAGIAVRKANRRFHIHPSAWKPYEETILRVQLGGMIPVFPQQLAIEAAM